VKFDFVFAQSVFSHTSAELLRYALTNVGDALGEKGVVVATFKEVEIATVEPGSRWACPECVSLDWATVADALTSSGLAGAGLDWAHPRQRCFIAARHRARVDELAQVSSPWLNAAVRDRMFTRRAE